MDKSTIKWLIIAAVIIGLIIVAVLIAMAAKPGTKTITGGGTTQTPGLGGTLGNILGGVFSGNWWSNIFGGGGAGNYETVNCDPNRPGYDKDGTPNPNCGKSYAGCTAGKCDPARPGFDECGFLNSNC